MRRRGRLIDVQPEELQRRRVGPVQVFPHHQDRLPLSLLQHPGHQRIIRLLPLLEGCHLQRGVAPIGQGHGQQRRHQGYDLVQGQAQRLECPLQFRKFLFGSVVACQAYRLLHMRDNGIEGTVGVIGRTPHGDTRQPFPAHVRPQRFHQCRFADARFPTDEHHLPLPGFTLLPAPQEEAQLLAPPDQGFHVLRSRQRGLAQRLQGAHDAPNPHGCSNALERLGPERFQDKGALHQLGRDSADHHSIGGSQPFEPRRNVGRFPQGEVLVSPTTAHFTHNHWPGMQAQPHGEGNAILSLQSAIQGARGLDNPQARMHGALGIIFMGARVAKVDEQTIAEILRDVPLKALDDLGGGLLIGAHYMTQVFGVELLAQPGGVDQIAEQHRQLPSFGFRSATSERWERGCSAVGGGWKAHIGSLAQDTVRGCPPPPDEPLTVLVNGAPCEQEFCSDIRQPCLVKAEDLSEGAIGDAAFVLQERAHQPEDASLAVKPPDALKGPLRRGERLACPAQAPARVIDDVGVGIEHGVFEVCDVGIIQGKLALQGTIGHAPTPPQHVEGLVQDLLKGHLALPSCMALCGVDNHALIRSTVSASKSPPYVRTKRWARSSLSL